MNDGIFKFINPHKNVNNIKYTEDNKHKFNEKNYNLNQFTKWIGSENFEEKPKPIINNKSNYNVVNYGNWIGLKNYDEKIRYYKKSSSEYYDEPNKDEYGFVKLKIYVVLIFNFLQPFLNNVILWM